MPVTIAAYENSATIGTTEWSIVSNSSGPDAAVVVGAYQAFIDCNALAAGDVFELRVYETVATAAGTQRLVFKATIANAQAQPVFVSPTLMLGVGWDMTLVKIAGTDRALPWRIAKAA